VVASKRRRVDPTVGLLQLCSDVGDVDAVDERDANSPNSEIAAIEPGDRQCQQSKYRREREVSIRRRSRPAPRRSW
jgi:hypothetical protein